jgi:hypothetical protein
MSLLLTRKFGIQVIDARPAWRGNVADIMTYVVVGAVAYVLVRMAHGSGGVDERDDNYCMCMAAVAVAVAVWLS